MFRPGTVIVDSGSTFNGFNDAQLLADIADCPALTTHSNGGNMDYPKHGRIQAFPALTAYYNQNCLVNIISLDLLQEKYHVTFDSAADNVFLVELKDDVFVRFEGFGSGLYVCNLNDNVNVYNHAISCLNTVSDNKSFYSRREIEGAERAREQQAQLGWPSDREYYEIIEGNMLKNSRCTLDDINNAKHIYGGSAVELLKGKDVYRPVNTASQVERVEVPPTILQTHPKDELDIDFCYIQGAPYLLIKSAVFKFQAIMTFNRISRIITKGKNKRITYKRGPNDIIKGIEKVIEQFTKRGFKISIVNGDNEFKKLEGKLSVHIEICGAGQHIPRIERGIRYFKDGIRCYFVGLPFKKVPKLMIDECARGWIGIKNSLPQKNGVSKTTSPSTFILGNGQIDGNNLKGIFGKYYEVFDGTDNTTKERRLSCICLRPSNGKGGYYFMNLHTGKMVHGWRFKELAMPDWVIDKVHELAEAEDAPDLDEDGCPFFEWELGTPIRTMIEPQHNHNRDNNTAIMPDVNDTDTDNNEDKNDTDADDQEDPDENKDENDHDDAESISDDSDISFDSHSDDESLSNDVDISYKSDTSEEARSDDPKDTEESRSATVEVRSDPAQKMKYEDLDLESLFDDESDDNSVHELRSEIDTDNILKGPRNRKQTSRFNIGSTGGKKYHVNMLQISNDRFAQFEKIRYGLYSTAVGICFNQMTASKGIKLFGPKAIAAMFKEYKQLNDLKVLGRINVDALSPEQKRKALRAVNLIKEKRCGKIKGRTVADGSVQRKYVPREEASSPTLSLEALMGVLLINSFEERDVAVFDVPGAYLHADIPDDKFVLLKFEGDYFVDIMCDVNPEYKEDVRYENGKKVLYVQILKALYGMIESALLWYTLYTDVLQKEGFVINPYDKCVANKMIDDKQCTIAWYVDDNILSHINPAAVDDVLKTIEGYFPGLVIERGKKLNFLGMEIDFVEKGKFALSLVQYITGMIEELEECLEPYGINLDTQYAHPANKNLFVTTDGNTDLPEDRADIFRKFVAKLIWVEKRGRPDVETSVSFLCTRVKQPNEEDWFKFIRLMSWIKTTKDDVRFIGADDLLNLFVMIDSSHAVHGDMRGHTGGISTFGTGVFDQKSSKQRMNTRSSTETEHVGTSEYLPKPIFFELFMEHQGYKPNITLWKDNESEIRMLNNGKDSCTSNSKHVAIKYFWSTDRIKAGKMKVKYCPTEKMIADYMSKPLQGKLFQIFRNVLMGWAHINTLYDFFAPTEERVENNGKTAVEAKKTKQTFADVVRATKAVEQQNDVIGRGLDPLEHLNTNANANTSLKTNNPEL
jgi:hypothetical protein